MNRAIAKTSLKILGSILLLTYPALGADSAKEGETLKVGVGKASFSGLLQAWLISDSTIPKINFRMRRAELGFKGSVTEHTRWFVMFDVAKSLKTGPIAAANDNKVLQDLGVAFNLCPDLEIMMGQFKIPTTFEGLAGASQVPLPERSFVGRTSGDRREPGLMLTYKKDMFTVQAMLSNGQGTNVDDTNDKKDLHVRVELTPTDSLLVGAFVTLGDFGWNQKGRVGANAKYSLDALTLRGELVQARDLGTTNTTGFMVDGAYSVNETIQPVVRFDGASTGGTFTGWAVTGGVNYNVLKNNARATLAYAYLKNMTGGGGAYTLMNTTTGHLFWLVFQAAM